MSTDWILMYELVPINSI